MAAAESRLVGVEGGSLAELFGKGQKIVFMGPLGPASRLEIAAFRR
jgi:hypothetical protein